MKGIFIFGLLILTALSGCAQRATAVTAQDLEHHRYLLQTVDGKTLAPSTFNDPEISFGENLHITGSMCNRFRGQAKLDNTILNVETLAQTRMLCPEENRNALDGIINEILTEGAQVTKNNNILILKGQKHTLVYKLADLVN